MVGAERKEELTELLRAFHIQRAFRRAIGNGKFYDKRCTVAVCALAPDMPVEGFDQLFDNRQPQSCGVFTRSRLGRKACEFLEELLLVVEG